MAEDKKLNNTSAERVVPGKVASFDDETPTKSSSLLRKGTSHISNSSDENIKPGKIASFQDDAPTKSTSLLKKSMSAFSLPTRVDSFEKKNQTQRIHENCDTASKDEVPRTTSRQAFTDWDINPLSLPRGTKLFCELCQDRKCRYQCTTCRSAYYCSNEHRQEDYAAVHKHICSRIEFLKGHWRNHYFPLSEDERTLATRRKECVMKEIIEISRNLAEQSLYEGKPRNTLHQLRVSFQFSIELYGSNHINQIELYDLMSETYMRLGKLPKARQQLQKAEFILKDHLDDCPYDIIADFYKIEGFLNLIGKHYTEALTSFGNEVYYATCAHHVSHPKVGTGLFHLGQTFAYLEDHKTCLSHFMHTIDIWIKRFGLVLKRKCERMDTKITITQIGNMVEKRLDESTDTEQNILGYTVRYIQDYLTMRGKSKTIPLHQKAMMSCALGIVHHLFDDNLEASDLALKTKLYLRDLKDTHLTETVNNLHRLVKKALNQKDFKSASKSFKNLAKLRRKTLTLEEIIHQHCETALRRKKDRENERNHISEQNYKKKAKAKKTIFGEDGYTLQERKKTGASLRSMSTIRR